jgi:PAS domain S-box-containing protein
MTEDNAREYAESIVNTVRVKAEDLLTKSEAKLRAVLDAAPFPVAIVDLEDNNINFWSHSAHTIFGHTAPTTEKWYEIAYPDPEYRQDVVNRWKPFLEKARLSGQTVNTGEYRITCRDGSERICELFAAFINENLVVTFNDITERKQAVKSLCESEEKYRLLHENAGVGIGYYKPDGTVLSFNRLAASLMNGVPEDFVGKSIYELFPKQGAEVYHARIKKACLVDEPMVYEDMIPLPPGNMFLLSTFTKITNMDNNILGIQIISQDITGIKQAEFKLSESESRFRSVFEQSSVGSVFVGLDKRFIKCNRAFCTFLGYKENELIGKAISDITFPGDVEVGMKELKRIAEGKLDSFSVQKRYVRKDGMVVWGETSISMVRDSTGDPLYFLPVIKDITDRKNAEESLQESEERYRTLADTGQALIWTSGLDKKCNYFNIPWLTFTGKRLEDEVGDGWVNGVHPDDLEHCIDVYVNSFDRREKFSMNYRIRHNSGEYRWIQDDGTPRYNSKKEFIGYIGHCLDITDRKRAEEALSTVQKLESLGLLAGGIAHDFNNLMGGIFGYIDMASEASTEDKVTQYLSKAMNTIGRARALTQQLLTFAKGGAPIQQIGNLFPFVRETAQFALSGANVSCNFDAPQDLWACNFDKHQIGQVVDNLIINAQQAMPVGGTIELTARNVTLAEKEHPLLANGNYVRISVKDTGVGIPKELISKIFDPFFTTKAMGHGLGLATCHSIVHRHGGCIDVESEPGKGSIFKVYLPATTESSSAAIKKTDTTHKGIGTFLVMDDEEVMRETIRGMLELLGYTVVSKENGTDAIEFFTTETKANRKITGMIFDLTVPGGMGGKAAIEEIRKTNTDIPAFVASGYADDPVMKTPAEYGFMASICKPFRKFELSEMLNKFITP